MVKMRNFIQSGNTIPLIAPRNVKSGEVVVVGSFAGIAAFDALANAEVEVALTGVYELPAIGPITQGEPVYFEPGSGKVTAADSPTTPLLGVAVAAVGESGTTCRVRLNGFVVPAAA
jgi:predicted RecA/RadA family phage recombinase